MFSTFPRTHLKCQNKNVHFAKYLKFNNMRWKNSCSIINTLHIWNNAVLLVHIVRFDKCISKWIEELILDVNFHCNKEKFNKKWKPRPSNHEMSFYCMWNSFSISKFDMHKTPYHLWVFNIDKQVKKIKNKK